MLHGVLMDIVEPRQVGVLVGQPGIPKVVPHRAAFNPVSSVEFYGRPRVQFPQKLAHGYRIGRAASYEVIVVCKHRPRFKVPDTLPGKGQKHPLHQIELGWRVEQALFMQCARSDDVDAMFSQPMDWSVGPVFRRELIPNLFVDDGSEREAGGARGAVIVYGSAS